MTLGVPCEAQCCSPARASSGLERRQELGNVYCQDRGQLLQVIDGDVGHTPLQLGDIRAMKSCLFGKLLLAQFASRPQRPNVGSNALSGGAVFMSRAHVSAESG